MKNKEIASLLYEIADIFELKEVAWKPQAYRRAAQSIESFSEDLRRVYKKGGKKGLRKIPGVGEAIAMHIEEYLETGKVKKFEKLKKSIPPGLKDLLEVSSLGTKRTMILYKKLRVRNISELKKAIEKHKISKLEGFGQKSEENISKGIETFKKGQERMRIGEVLPIAEDIISTLKKFKEIKRVGYAGSLRRMEETIGDIDILATSQNPEKVIKLFSSLSNVKRVLLKGPTKCSVILEEDIQADIRVVKEREYGAAMQYFTGSKEHNIRLREIAMKKGLKLSEYGLFRGRKKIGGKTEEEIYNKLGLRMMPPEIRQNTGEFEVAKKGLPKFVEVKDIKGDLHVHTNYSDGSNTISQMAEEGMKRGYEYIAVTDHSKTRVNVNGLTESRLKKQWKEIDNLNKNQRKIRIFKGTECDILGDGSLDFSDKILRKFDVVVASIHSGFQSSEREMTDRVINALENKYVTVLGHPTGRIINKRDPFQIDLEEVFDSVRRNKKAIEINSQPMRLDLKGAHVRAAINAGCKISINTDSHSHKHLDLIKYGIGQARRGWVEKKDVINSLNLKKLLRFLKKD